MIGIILAGGFATRLKPLSNSIPKPLFPFMNSPIIEHQILKLIDVGVSRIILATGNKHDIIKSYVDKQDFKAKIEYAVDTRPNGTGGAIYNAIKTYNIDEDVFVMNGDIFSDLNLTNLISDMTSIALTMVKDPSKYGVAILDVNNMITSFVEKPTNPETNLINAGIYYITRNDLKLLKEGYSMVEREFFPILSAQLKLRGVYSDEFWSDLGTPESLLYATKIKSYSLMDNRSDNSSKESVVDKSSNVMSCTLDNVIVMENCKLNSVRASHCIIGRNCSLYSCDLKNVVVAEGSIGENIVCHGISNPAL